MKGNKSGAMPRFDSIDELVNFFDGNDMGEFDEQMEPAEFEVHIKRRKWLVSLDEGVAKKLRQIARERQMSSEALTNAWLMEKIREEPRSNQQSGAGGRT